jgi:hypothetical protein
MLHIVIQVFSVCIINVQLCFKSNIDLIAVCLSLQVQTSEWVTSYLRRAVDVASAWRRIGTGCRGYLDAVVVILCSNQLMAVPPCLVPPSSSTQVFIH